MGWHGSALTVGTALGVPVVGFAIDQGSWRAGFVLAGVIGVMLAAIGLVVVTLRRHARPQSEPESVRIGTDADADQDAGNAGQVDARRR